MTTSSVSSLSEPAWDSRWGVPWEPPDEPQPLVRRRRLVTHVVLVDGLPADHWVEESADGTWESRGRRRGPLRSIADAEPTHERALRWLEAAVGGADALRSLETSPLTATPLPLEQIPLDLHARAQSIIARCDAVAIDVFDTPELVAAFRHILTAVLTLDPATLHRSDRDETAVGAVVWIGGQANGLIGPRGAVLARELWDLLDVSSSAAARGAGILHRLTGRAVDPDPPVHWGAPHLRATGMPGALVSSTRAVLVARRDAAWADLDAAAGGAERS